MTKALEQIPDQFHLDKWRPQYLEEIRELPPSTVIGIAQHFGVIRHTIYRWMERFPEFALEVKRCQEGLVDDLETAMVDQACGRLDGNATAGIFLLKNLAPDDYRDRREHVVEQHTIVELDFMGYDEDELDAIEAEYEEVVD